MLLKKWMVMGYDTYHDAKQRRAVGALVASINNSFTRFHSAVKIHENNEEISPNFRGLVLDALQYDLIAPNYFHQVNN